MIFTPFANTSYLYWFIVKIKKAISPETFDTVIYNLQIHLPNLDYLQEV